MENRINDMTIDIPVGVQHEASHFQKPEEFPFYASQRATTTLLLGGLTEIHEELIIGHLRGIGYNADRLECPDKEALDTGKEFCNRGQCNPTYFTIGNLVKHLKKLNETMSVKEIEENYIFLTAGSCGPCRFGMYESEYRKAVSDAGFKRFRVMVIQQAGGLGQFDYSEDKPGIDMNKTFFGGFLKAIFAADVLNQVAFKVIPYEVEKGAGAKARKDAVATVKHAFENRQSIFKAMKKAGQIFNQVECDYTQVKPLVKITGEFWASITEGDGNYHLKQWLMDEGAEVVQEPLTGWVEHLLYSREIKSQAKRGTEEKKSAPYLNELKLAFFRRTVNTVYNYYRAAMNFKADNTISNKTLAKYAHKYYNKHMGGGEAYMEVGNFVHCAKNKKVHLMISVKPFGCMPSTASDGVQSRVMADYPDFLFLPVETSGDSEVNFKSRVQMKLFEAKQKCQKEYQEFLSKTNVDISKVQDYTKSNKKLRGGLHTFKKSHTSTGLSFLESVYKKVK